MISDISFNGMTVNPKSRFEHLCKIEDHLSTRTDQKLEWGCHHIGRKVSYVKWVVLAQTLWVVSGDASDDIKRRAYRWLFAHTNESRDRFNPRLHRKQWQNIINSVFLWDHGKYAELAVLERILLNVLKPKWTGVSISDIFFADTMGDRSCMTDWIMHQQFMHGVLHWGIQLGVSGFISKQHDLNKRHLHDRWFIHKNVPQVVHDFLRHTTIVLTLPGFKTEKPMRQSAFQHLMGGSVRYQAEHITRHGNKNFTDLGQSFLRAMEFFQMGVRDRLIDSHYDYLDHHTFSYTDPKTGEVITCRIWSNEWMPTLDINMMRAPYFKKKLHSADRPRIIQETILKMSIPIPSEFLDIMRDMMWVRAE